ncbi:MAG: MoaD/ThiS family protein [Actinobacteria bacterium]|nr:MoaD/ThiS family protein [Actinomycetota bacterium]
MAIVALRAPLKDLAGGRSEVKVDGASVIDVLRALEAEHPRIVGWILDEQGRIRRHVNVFVNGELTREDAPLSADDRVQVLHSITGGTA